MKIRSNISGAVYDVTRAGICIEIVYAGCSQKVLVLDVRSLRNTYSSCYEAYFTGSKDEEQ